MTDIVERLGRDLMEISYDDIEAMVRDAAAEIERLRAALQLIRDDAMSPPEGPRDLWIEEVVGRALEPKP